MDLCKHRQIETINEYNGIKLLRCDRCHLVISSKYLKGFNPHKVYRNYYRNEVSTKFVSGVEYIIKTFRFFRAFKLFTINPQAKSILDIGSGRGYTLYFLKKYYGYTRTAGIQIEKNSYNFSKNRLGLEMYNKDLLQMNLKSSSFNFVTMWHVLEHVKHPEKYIVKMRSLLKNNGRMVIEVPNFNSWTRKICGKYWLGLDPKYHLYFFDRNSLTKLLRQHSLSIQKTQTFSLEYSTFTSTQSIVSRLTNTDHVFFNYIQGGKFNLNIILHIFLFIVVAPVSFVINIFLYKSDYGEDLLVIAKK